MSKHKTPIIRWFWEQVGGALIEEYPAMRRTATCGQRLIYAIILPKRDKKIAHWRDVSLVGEDVIVVHAKTGRLGMYLMGQVYFSGELINHFNPSSIMSVALCEAHDTVLSPMLEKSDHIEIVIYPGVE